MLCEYSGWCEYYSTYKTRTAGKQYLLLINSYCEGILQPMCRRIKYQTETGEPPPLTLCPNGYHVGGHKKEY
jgi:hypothetical protein